MTDGWTLAAQARREFADMIESLDDEQMATETLCAGWTPRHVLAHQVTFVDVPLPKFMWNVIKNRGDFDTAADSMAKAIAERPVPELLATLRDKAGKRSSFPTFPGELTVADSVVHQQDVRRGLGLGGAPSPDLVRCALDFITTDKKASLISEKGATEGLRLEATDLDWSHGDGPVVSGPGEAILLTVCGRDVGGDVSGDGVATLRERAG